MAALGGGLRLIRALGKQNWRPPKRQGQVSFAPAGDCSWASLAQLGQTGGASTAEVEAAPAQLLCPVGIMQPGLWSPSTKGWARAGMGCEA